MIDEHYHGQRMRLAEVEEALEKWGEMEYHRYFNYSSRHLLVQFITIISISLLLIWGTGLLLNNKDTIEKVSKEVVANERG